MAMVNFFESKIVMTIYLHRAGFVVLENNGKPLYQGPRESVMAHIRQIMSELNRLGNKEVVFTILNYSTDPMQAGMDRGYFKTHLATLASGSTCTIRVNAGMDTKA